MESKGYGELEASHLCVHDGQAVDKSPPGTVLQQHSSSMNTLLTRLRDSLLQPAISWQREPMITKGSVCSLKPLLTLSG
jgi:hypothetical protein